MEILSVNVNNDLIVNNIIGDSAVLAIVVPIFKKGSSSNVANYRPISLTNSCCKIFESVIKIHLLEFLFARKIISKNQHGCLSRRST